MRGLLTVGLLTNLLIACGEPLSDSSLIDGPTAALPALLSETGLFPDMGDPSDAHARAIEYAPQYPLWSNGSQKLRHVVLPEGARIDASDDEWSFPEGTLFFKTFAFEDDDASDGLRYVETRVLRRLDDGWEPAAYLWRDDRSDADLLEGRTATEVPVTYDGEEFLHGVPSKRQCRTCHESARVGVLGFTGLQLNDGEQLPRLRELDVFQADMSEPDAIDSDDEWLLGYVTGNCVHCHNGWADGANSSFRLDHEVFLDNTLDRETESSASGIGTRIVPGDAAQSVLYLAFTAQDNGTGVEEMPPLGVQLRDAEMAERLRQWIDGLAE
jgi:hypothetical protein